MILAEQLTINNKKFMKTCAFSLKLEYAGWTQEKILTAIAESDNFESEYYKFDVNNIIETRYYIEREGVQYSEAIDPIGFISERIYTETNIPIENDDELLTSDNPDLFNASVTSTSD